MDYMIAFSAHDNFDHKEKYDDPSLVDWEVWIIESDGMQENKIREVGVHRCTEIDYSLFYKAEESQRDLIE